MKTALVLLAHGARDSRWAEPFERLRELVRQRAPTIEVRLAYLELMQPDLKGAVAELATLGVTAVRVAPVFFGRGGHVREDLPQLLAELARDYPTLSVTCVSPVGEAPRVVAAMAEHCLEGLET